jgi:cytochrome c oxidase cbb3-type subunit I/II
LFEKQIDWDLTPKKISAMQTLGVPYPAGYENQAVADAKKQAEGIVSNLKKAKVQEVTPITPDDEIVALIAYLQRVGTDIKVKPVAENK